MYSYMGTGHPDALSNNRTEPQETGPSQQNAGEGTPLVRFFANRDGKFYVFLFEFSVLVSSPIASKKIFSILPERVERVAGNWQWAW